MDGLALMDGYNIVHRVIIEVEWECPELVMVIVFVIVIVFVFVVMLWIVFVNENENVLVTMGCYYCDSRYLKRIGCDFDDVGDDYLCLN